MVGVPTVGLGWIVFLIVFPLVKLGIVTMGIENPVRSFESGVSRTMVVGRVMVALHQCLCRGAKAVAIARQSSQSWQLMHRLWSSVTGLQSMDPCFGTFRRSVLDGGI